MLEQSAGGRGRSELIHTFPPSSHFCVGQIPTQSLLTRESFPRQVDFRKKCGKIPHVDQASAQSSAAADRLLTALQRIFRPLVRLFIARSIPYSFVANLLRGVYVDVAVKEFPVAEKRQTDSRITLLTGIHRKDVKRLRSQPHLPLRPPRAVTLASQLIARWTTLPEYLDAHGAPQPLPRLPADDGTHSFESLVRSVNTDIRPRVILDEWLRLGIAQLDEHDRVCLNVAAFIPPRGSEEMTYYFGRNLHDHVAAAVHNMTGEADAPEPLLERSVNYNNLTPAAVSELTAVAKQRGMEILQELNARGLRLQQRDAGQTGATQRFNFGLYLFIEDQSADTEEPDDAD